MKIKAAVLNRVGVNAPYSISQPVSIEEVDLDSPGRGEVLIRIAAAGVCHSDISAINGDRPRPVPLVLGHEAAGIVEELGPGVDDLKRGDHVVLVSVPSCGHCLPCRQGAPLLCEPGTASNGAGTLLSGERRLRHNGSFLNHHLGCSAFAEYSTVSRHTLTRVDPDLPLGEAALFGCAVLTGAGAVLNTARIGAGASVAVVGLGGVGLCSLLAAVMAGARQIVAVDLSPDKLRLARELGATDAFNAAETNCVEQVRTASDGGVEFAFEMAGSVPAMETAFGITRRGGTTVTAGLPRPGQMLGLPQARLVSEERTVKGSYIGSSVPLRDIPRYMSLYRQGRFPIDRLITGRLKLADINHALDCLNQGGAIRQVIVF
jgi:alcohol dehydrogenase